jgi:hypothetical protein
MKRSKAAAVAQVDTESAKRAATVRRLIAIAAVTVGTLLAGTLSAQSPLSLKASSYTAPQERQLFGTVSDDLGRPIAGVEVTVRDKSGTVSSVTTDAAGAFLVPSVPEALFAVGARQTGFAPVARLLREAPGGALDFVLPHVDDEKIEIKAERDWRRELELYDRAMKVALPSGVLTPEDFALGKTSFTGDLLNLLPGYPRAGSRTASNCTEVLLNDFPQKNVSVANIPVENLKLVMVRNPGNPLPDAWRPFVYSSACTVVAVYTL